MSNGRAKPLTRDLQKLTELADALGRGHFVKQDFAQARYWAERLHGKACPKHLDLLATMYARGDGGEKDMSYANEWFCKPHKMTARRFSDNALAFLWTGM